ncbi:hypothetical protein GLOIN_2v1487826 [Rhizophagus irregularis DAOM 181602=DAOM 197198]|uniref:Uncharacterized protein n=3 Tax=Rhizophagus irregularis TaxID=588596 RepID=U9U845_RHIID|nr:hypothetical protein GLOIN_2v1487826 [Rhizophagus irregularis DAOM 181602=DAOM 197198]EXX57868.1 hypothetical protein RirG_203140 [Rhizophagus irregularis DAOM 197198w]POG59414.1 hypothetical protein GLOIN_2v1487826 [Rhizophagus irregularis DAOM 181602=DAOM 197198]GBC38237.1 hypothetical protein GLOIN_2v1487826 [Rhizophagus irregularis DAOM 181602=DAOM 197198]|eukprot:XP_025166280.1 hypothetical protein GLOIN_2v1487826 [Rhizophagus irregularis DAOM 181602=DAOM 197198]
MNSNFHSGLVKDISLLLNDSNYLNVTIHVGENENAEEFKAHSIILCARSDYFKCAFSNEWVTMNNNMITFNKPNIAPKIFEMILKYIYAGELDLTNQPGENILELLVASDELVIEELFEHLQDYLIEKRQTWVKQNFVFVLHTVFKIVRCKKLQDYCLKSICTDILPFITSKEFLLLNKDILYELLKRDDFRVEAIVVWESLIKWSIKQIPELEKKNNQEEWIDENYEDLKDILSNFIPLIKFLDITSEDFYHKVRPYKAIIPNDIYEKVMAYYLIEQPKSYLHTISPQIESNIIKSKLTNIIINWIDKKHGNFIRTKEDILYKFKLVYRDSRDGINNESFRNKCEGQVGSLILIKVNQSNKIFGGFSSIGFNSIGNDLLQFDFNGYNSLSFYYSLDNFIFSFENNEDIQNMKISRVIDYSKAILNHYTFGFNFGRGSLYMKNQYLFINSECDNYEKNLNINDNFIIEEIETYIVVKQ